MADLSLRAYHRKIENWIEDNEVDKAIYQSAYLLGEFPKDLQTWQCLSKALLQKQDFNNADQVFDIILRIDPDDFIAHIGKSMAAENRGELEVAVKQMRRAFEIQPSNEGLQNELKRLIQKKDGVEPENIHLTRGALIKMYLRGELYEQAIAEALIGVRESPQRIDFHLALAEGYEKTGEFAKAVETCVYVLGELPYCMKANKILYGILNKSADEDIPQIYHQHLVAVDPYYAYITETTSSVLDVPDIAVMLKDRSDLTPEPVDIGKLIRKSWEKDTESTREFKASDWQNIIDKALRTSKGEMDFSIGNEYEHVSEAEMNKPASADEMPQQLSRKEIFLNKMHSSAQKEKSQIPEWIFDENGELMHQPPSEPIESASENKIEAETKVSELTGLSEKENGLETEENEAPVFIEPHLNDETESQWISETDHKEMDEKNKKPENLQDTQEIKVPDYEPAYMLDIAEKAVVGENFNYALETFRKLIAQGDYTKDVIYRLERIVQQHPGNSDLLLFLGELYTKMGRREEALEVYRKAQKIISL